MKVLKYVLAVFFILIGVSLLLVANFFSSLFAILLGIALIPSVGKTIKEKLQLWNMKPLRYVGYFLLLFLVIMFIEPTELTTEKTLAKKEEKVSTKEATEKDSLNVVLKEYDLTICKIYSDVSALEAKAIKEADKKYPNFGIKHTNYSEDLRVRYTNTYLKEKKLSNALLQKAIIYSTECSEKERLQRIEEARIKKALKAERKEKIQECYNAAREVLSSRIKKNMHDPSSFEYVDCKYLGVGKNTFTVLYSYRGKNAFGATILQKTKFEIDIETCKIVSVK